MWFPWCGIGVGSIFNFCSGRGLFAEGRYYLDQSGGRSGGRLPVAVILIGVLEGGGEMIGDGERGGVSTNYGV
jgi:hypothetical protein